MNFLIGSVSKTIQNRIVYDEELIIRLQRGDEWAFQLLVRRFRKKIFSIAFGITVDVQESQDIMQEVFLQVYRGIAAFKGESSLSTWLHRITVNRCLNWKRRWSRRLRGRHVSMDSADTLPEKKLQSDLPSPENRLADAQTHLQIDRALKLLPDQIRVVFVLKELEGLSYEEIANALDIKIGTVRSRLFNARKRLKAILQPLVEEK